MTDLPSTRPAADRMWGLVPGWTRYRHEPPQGTTGPNLLHGVVEALAVGIDAVHDDIARLLDDMFVDTCDPRLVPLIGDLVGASVDPDVPIARQRHQVKYAVHLRRRKGTIEQLEALGWQITGFRTQVREAPSTQRTVFDPQPSARISGAPPPTAGATAANLSGRIPPGRIEIALDVAWPVRRSQVELQRVGPDVHAVDPRRDAGLRRADGTPIFRRDDPAGLVGDGRAIEVTLIGADFPVLGALRPRFMSLPDTPPYVPDHTLAIDPERGRVAGPTAPMPGIRAYRRYQLRFWEPMRGELVEAAPADLGDGLRSFAPDGRLDGLTDADGVRLLLGFEGQRGVPVPRADERLLIVREPGHRRHGRAHAPFVLLPPGQPLAHGTPAAAQGLLLDGAGLNRLFSIVDVWGWDLFRTVRLVHDLDREPPADDTVEVDLARGRFRIGPAHVRAALRVRYYRRFDVAAIQRRGAEALRRAVPLGRTARIVFRDTAPGSSEEL
jgi:hypothetical protein